MKQLYVNDGFARCANENYDEVTELIIGKDVVGFTEDFSKILFHGMPNLAKVTVEKGNIAFTAHCGVLYDSDMSYLIYYPKAKNRKVFKMPSTVTKINPHAFTDGICGNRKLEEVHFSTSLKEIPEGCFENMGIWSIFMEDGIESIGDRAFRCTNLVCPTITPSVKKLGKNVFEGCKRMHLLNIAGENQLPLADSIAKSAIIVIETLEDISIDNYDGRKVMNFVQFEEWLDAAQ